MRQVAFLDDPIYDQHNTGGHPENADRLKAVREALAVSKVREAFVPITPTPASVDDILLAHTGMHHEHIARIADAGGDWIDGDTLVTARSYDVARVAAGAAIAAVESVVTGVAPTAFTLVRPPGHHASCPEAVRDRSRHDCGL